MMRRNLFRSSNPVLLGLDQGFASDTPATYGGVVAKSLFLFTILAFTGGIVAFNQDFFFTNQWILFAAMIGGFITILFSRTPSAAKVGAPIYAALQGIVIGMIAVVYNFIAPGIVESAILLTLSIFLVMLILYATGLVRVGPIFTRVVYAGLGGLVLFSFVAILLSFFSPGFADLFYGNLQFILIISLIGAALASLMILVDLDRITMIVRSGADESVEWIAALGLMVTIIWLFLEILRILLVFASRSRD